MSESAWLLVGLGNPGAEYARNRHNIGFMVPAREGAQNKDPTPLRRMGE